MRPALLPCILGPTGAGKTAAALALARRFPVSVINADSRQVYRDFPLITAQPSPAEQSACPHLLYGFLPTEAKLGAGEWARQAATTIAEEQAKGRQPLLVGGTGLYFKALLAGIAPIPDVPAEVSAHWQSRAQAEGAQALHALLAQSDPAYAAKIHPNDRQRITRALEVYQATGHTFTWWHARPLPPPPFAPLYIGIGLSLAELEPILAQRIHRMLEAGALEEARAALSHCAAPTAPGWSGIGCAELYQYISGALSLEACRALWLKNTRAYAKRQLTWFRADKAIAWFSPGHSADIVETVARALEQEK